MTNETTARSIIRMVGVMAIGVAAAWAFQVLGLGGSGTFAKLMWVLGAAAVAGAGAGLLYSSSALQDDRDTCGGTARHA